MYWWQHNGLIGDPFDRISGIEEIDTPSLIVETEIFRKYNNMLTDPRNLLGKSIIIFGEFGSGRTTLFSYLKSLFHREGMNSFIVRLHGSFEDSAEIEQKFFNSFFFKLTGELNEDVSLQEIIKELREIKINNKRDRYFIFLDELHKNQMITSSLQFLKDLQGIIEEINEDVHLSIMIAGRNDWKEEITNDPVYSGSFGSYDEFGDMTVEEAYSMIDKRIRYFHTNPEKYTPFSLVKQDAIAKIYSTIEIKTPRSILRAASRLIQEIPESINLITSSEIHRYLGKNVLFGIRNHILSVSSVHFRLSNIEKLGDKNIQEEAIKSICKIYNEPLELPLETSTGHDPQLVAKMLRKNLLQKSKNKIKVKFSNINVQESVGGDDYIVIDDAIKSVFDSISEKFQVSPEDYLLTIFFNKEIFIQSNEDETSGIIKRIVSIKEKLPDNLDVCKNWIDTSLLSYRNVANFEINGIPKEKESEFIRTCESAMDDILNVYYAIREDVNHKVEREESLKKILLDCDFEELSEFFQKIRLSKESGTIHQNNRDSIIDLFYRAYHKVIEIAIGELDLGQFIALKSEYIQPNEMEYLRDIRSKIFDQVNYFEARLLIQELLKRKIADFFYFNLSVIYGIDWYKRLIPYQLANKLKLSNPEIEEKNALQKKELFYRELKELDLTDIYEIIEFRLFWEGFFDYVFGNKSNVRRLFNNINDVVNKPDDELNHNEILKIFDHTLKLVVFMNKSIEFYLESEQISLDNPNSEESDILFGRTQMEKIETRITKKEIDEGEFKIKKNIRDNKFKINRPQTALQVGLLGNFVVKEKIIFIGYEGNKLVFEIGKNFKKIVYNHKLTSNSSKCELSIENPKKDELIVQFSKPSDVIRYSPEVISLDESKINDIFEEIDRISTLSDQLLTVSKIPSEIKTDDFSRFTTETELNKTYHSSILKLGNAVYNLVLNRDIKCDVESCDLPIKIVIDEKLIMYPWELMYDGTDFLALKSILGRAIISKKRNLPPQKGWLRDGKIQILLIGVSKSKNEETLPWVKSEVENLKQILKQYPYIDIDVLLDEEATFTEVIGRIGKNYDFIHFAGHAFYDEKSPEKSGLILFDETLEAREIKNIIKNPPCLVFLNACSSAKIEQRSLKQKYANFVQSLSLAFIENGSQVIGSIWPISDEPAAEFCEEFYLKFFSGSEIGESLRFAKKKIYEKSKGDLTWASYVLYGDPCGFLETNSI